MEIITLAQRAPHIVTGKVFVRDRGTASGIIPGDPRRLVILSGIVAIPDDVRLADAHQYVLVGECTPAGNVGLVVYPDTGRHLPQTRGMDINNVLKQGYWQI